MTASAPVASRRRRFWGWGWEDGGPSPEHQQAIARAPRRTLRRRDGDAAGATGDRRDRPAALPADAARGPRPALLDGAARPRRAHLREVLPRRRPRLPPRLPQAPGRGRLPPRRRATSPRSSTGRPIPGPPWCRTAAARASWAASRRPAATAGPASSPSTSVVSTACSRSIRSSRAARIQAGVLGPALEEQLRPHGLTLRHFPQSFEFSSLGGWIATRSGGHYATLYTHIDEFVESLRVVTPTGVVETRRLPGSGAGPSPDRLFIGSEGILGVIVEAWMRLQDASRVPRRGQRHLPRLRRRSGRRARDRAGGTPSRQLPPARPGRGAHRRRR